LHACLDFKICFINLIVMLVEISQDLLTELKSGNEKAFTILFNGYFQRLCRFATGYVIDGSVAKNIVQDVFLKLWETRKNISEGSSIGGLLLTMTKNSCLDYLRHKHIESKYQQQIQDNQKEIELNYFALKNLEIDLLNLSEISDIIEHTINLLPPQCQHVFRMSRFQDLSNAEIAQQLDISVKAVEANITRALKIFRTELKDYITILFILNIPLI